MGIYRYGRDLEALTLERHTRSPDAPRSDTMWKQLHASGAGLHHPEPRADRFLDFFVLVLQQRQSIRDVVPLSLGLTTRESGCELVCELLGVLVLYYVSVVGR